jgi:hypothetical protein
LKFRHDTHKARVCGDSFLLCASCCFLLFSPFKFYYHSNTLYIFFTHIILFWTCRLLIFLFLNISTFLSLSFPKNKREKSTSRAPKTHSINTHGNLATFLITTSATHFLLSFRQKQPLSLSPPFFNCQTT